MFSQAVNHCNYYQIDPRKEYIEPDINLKKTVYEIKAKMNYYTVDQVIMLLHKEVHDKA